MAAKKGPSQRQLRVGELVRQSLAEVFGRGEIADEVIVRAGVTVLEVQASPDLRVATVYVRALFESDRDELIIALRRNARRIRGAITPKLSLKYMPEIRFEHDAAADHAARIDELLRSDKVRKDLSPDIEN